MNFVYLHKSLQFYIQVNNHIISYFEQKKNNIIFSYSHFFLQFHHPVFVKDYNKQKRLSQKSPNGFEGGVGGSEHVP